MSHLADGLKVMGRFVCGLSMVFSLLLTILTSCDGIDCTINNVVTLNVGFYNSKDGQGIAITDTLTITAEGTDSILYNKGVMLSHVSLPMSYWQEADTLHFKFYNVTSELTNDVVLYVKKTNRQHFESPDCPTTMFHEVQSVTFKEDAQYIDSIVVSNSFVNYDAQENIKIYFHTAD